MMVNLIFKLAGQEVICKPDHGAKALKRAAQIAGVVEVADSSETHSSVYAWLTRLVPLFDYFEALAPLFMISAVSGLAFGGAVEDLETVAADA
jgi:hypothetical protein